MSPNPPVNVPCMYPLVQNLKRDKTGSFASSSHGKKKFESLQLLSCHFNGTECHENGTAIKMARLDIIMAFSSMILLHHSSQTSKKKQSNRDQQLGRATKNQNPSTLASRVHSGGNTLDRVRAKREEDPALARAETSLKLSQKR